VAGEPLVVLTRDAPTSGADAAFIEYSQHFTASVVAEIRLLVENKGRLSDGSSPAPKDPQKFLTWSEIWRHMFEA
jgi:hypothetical protein